MEYCNTQEHNSLIPRSKRTILGNTPFTTVINFKIFTNSQSARLFCYDCNRSETAETETRIDL